MTKIINGFSKLEKAQKIEWLINNFLEGDIDAKNALSKFFISDTKLQAVIDGFSENTISNFILPYGLAPNFIIDDKPYCVPMVIEESSVVAAASAAAKYWQDRGGFKTSILGTVKVGQVHFVWYGNTNKLILLFEELKEQLLNNSKHLTEKMLQRGGGIKKIELLDLTSSERGLYQLKVHFETCDSMGANFINTVLENFAVTLEQFISSCDKLQDEERDVHIIMSILSNHTPECLVRAEVSCKVDDLGVFSNGLMANQLAEKFRLAVRIAHIDPHRATTHNKGIYNGIDAVILATGNDFRAVEASGHTYAAKDGQYRSLSHCTIEDDVFRFWLEVPMAIGTVGGLTALHPLAKLSLQILGQPSAAQLMRIIASVGLAQNFAAVRSLVTTGIQKGHMKMHLMNILNHLDGTQEEIRLATAFFENEAITFSGVRQFLESIRKNVIVL